VKPSASADGKPLPPFREWSWILTLFGTAVGAGILYLPLQVGVLDVFSLILLSLVAFPLIHYSHKNILNLLLQEDAGVDYPGLVAIRFGRILGGLVVATYFLTFYAVLFSYALGLAANLRDVLVHAGAIDEPPSWLPALSFASLAAIAALHLVGPRALLRVMSALSFALVAVLLALSLYLVPFWNVTSYATLVPSAKLFDDALLIYPILIFSFVYFPAMSSMVAAYRASADGARTDSRAALSRTLLKTTALLLAFVLFFVFSSILSLSPAEFQRAIDENLNCLALLSHKDAIPRSMVAIGSLVGLAALVTSFIGVFFGAREAAYRLLVHLMPSIATPPDPSQANRRRKTIDSVVVAVLFASLWLLTLANPSVMDLFGTLISPLVAVFLFILPVVLLARRNGLRALKAPSQWMVLTAGVVLLFSFKLGKALQVIFGAGTP
jgi:serine transporter